MCIMLQQEHPHALNMANGNVYALMGLLQLPVANQYGEASVVDMRRAIMKAKALFDKRADDFIEEPQHVGNFYSFGISKEYLRGRLNDLTETVEVLASMGATIIYWA